MDENRDMRLRIVGSNPPGTSCGPSKDRPDGYRDVHVGLQSGREVVGLVAGDQELDVEIDLPVRRGRFSGPFVHGGRGDRFVYLSWGEWDGREFRMFRRGKLRLEHLDADELADAAVEARLSLSDERGHPSCASLRPPRVEWTVTEKR